MGREDGRGDDDIRKVTIKRNFMKFAEGSCLIELGNTKVVCTASVEDGVPPFLRNTGKGWITAEYSMLPRSCKTRVPRESSRGKIGGRTHEIQRIVGRSLRSVTDTAALGERTIWIDCDVIQGDGGTRTASITGAFIVLADCLKYMKEQKLIEKIPVKDYIAAISVGIVNGKALLDLSYEEDSKAEVDMNIVMTSKGEFVEVQGTAEVKPFHHQDMNRLITLAEKGIKKLIGKQKKLLKI